jgi:hypothetical protein
MQGSALAQGLHIDMHMPHIRGFEIPSDCSDGLYTKVSHAETSSSRSRIDPALPPPHSYFTALCVSVGNTLSSPEVYTQGQVRGPLLSRLTLDPPHE